MRQLASTWWNQLKVQQKVLVILLGLFIPLVCALAIHVSLITHLLTVQQQRHDMTLALEQVQLLRRLGVDMEDAFRGYLLTRQDAFLKPMDEAELKLKPAVARMLVLVQDMPELTADVREATSRLESLLESKRTRIREYRAGREAEVLRYVRSGEGLRVSDTVRGELRVISDRLNRNVHRLEAAAAAITQYAFWGLLLAVAGVAVLGLVGARLLAASITEPLAVLQSSVAALGQSGASRLSEPIAVSSADEIGQLARAYEEMAGQVHRHIQELEALNAVGSEINTIGPDGLDGALHRITNRAAELIGADVCLVMLRNEKMGCWVVEAASGGWNERLYKSVMLWEEFPVSVEAFESKEPAFGENLRSDRRPEMLRRNLMGESMLAIPLLSQGMPFGVLVLLREQQVVPRDGWHMRLAKGFADEAAMAITNARLYERVKEKGKGLQARLTQLEHLAETLAHDLRSPGERMGEFAALLMGEYGSRLDERATRWLNFIEENGRLLRQRVEDMLTVAHVGGRTVAIEAVDPALVIHDVLKSRASEIERRCVRVRVDGESPMVACHRAYFHQAMDNLVSNAIKFSADRPDPLMEITWKQTEDRVTFSVSDNGVGIPDSERRRVFEPFVRLHPATAKGSGIGLAIVRRIVELYDGEVWIESGIRGGCTVAFTLPVLGEFSLGRS